jgi:hypothetical protein
MAVTVKIDPIGRDISLLISDLTGDQKSQIFAEFARQEIDAAKETNRQALGSIPPYEIFVDGRRGAQLETVKPDGIIVAEFELVIDVLRYIGEQLVLNSPVDTGRYERSHKLFADGVEIDPESQILNADEYVFINTQPYARKIEQGLSPQAPDGVYQATATLAKQRFSRVARITFSYRGLIGGFVAGGAPGNRSETRQPAIIVRPGTRN